MNNLFDRQGYIAYPLTIRALAEELIKITDDYRHHRLTNEEFKEIIQYYAENSHEKFFTGNDFNISIKRLVGKTRLKIISPLVTDYLV